MIEQQGRLCERLKRLGYAQGKQVRMYGEEFQLVSDPIVIQDNSVVVDAIERKSGSFRRIGIPLSVTHMIRQELNAA